MSHRQVRPKPDHILATDQQWEAISLRGDNILVSASAGSGKTKVLIERIMHYIEDGVSIENLLIVTFTEAAAKEMKERLRQQLEKAISTTEDPRKRSLYLSQLTLIPKAQISTIHSFCMQVIRSYFYLVHLDPVFTLMDETEASLLKERVWLDLEEQVLTQKPELEEVLTYFSNDRNDRGIQQLVDRVYEFSRSKPHPKTWLSQLNSLYSFEGDFFDHPYLKEVWYPEAKMELEGLVEKFSYLIQELGLYLPDKTYQAYQDLMNQLSQTWLAFRDRDFTGAYEAAQKVTFPRWYSSRTMEESTKSALGLLKGDWDQAKETWQERWMEPVFLTPPSQLTDQAHHLGELLGKFSTLMVSFYEAYQGAKFKANRLDYSDLEHQTLSILSYLDPAGRQPAADYYRQHYHEILVDEYQDVNRVQEAILQSIVKPHNYFMVGDVKQSIYAFRLADPSLFSNKYLAFRQEEGGHAIILADNFRSRSQVLEFTNLIFKQIMDQDFGQIDYDEAAHLRTGNKSYSQEDLDKFSELVILTQENSETDQEMTLEGQEEEELEQIDREILYMAGRIRQLLKDDFQIMRETKGPQGQLKRSLQYKDIAILAPTKSHNQRIEEIFQSFDIPVVIQKKEAYFKRTEIATVLACLQVIDNPLHDIPLVAVLRSGMVGLDEIELAHIRLANPRESYFASIKAYLQAPPLPNDYLSPQADQALREKVGHFMSHLEDWRNASNNVSLAKLIWKIYQDSHFMTYVQGLRNGPQRLLNLHALYELAGKYEASSFKGLRPFIKYVQKLQEKEKDLEEPAQITEGQDAVRVMTIHASKGLEFPLVFLMHAGKTFNEQSLRQNTLMSDQIGFATKYLDYQEQVIYPNLFHFIVKEHELNKSRAEEMRKLYVAMTRAREKLIIVGTEKNLEGKIQSWQETINSTQDWLLPQKLRESAKSYLDWLIMSLLRFKDFKEFHGQDLIDFSWYELDDTELTRFAHQWQKQASLDPLGIEGWESHLSDLDLSNNLIDFEAVLEGLRHEYPHKLASQTASYQSVSELKRIKEDPDLTDLPSYATSKSQGQIYLMPQLEGPKFLETGQKQIKGNVLGTASHLILQRWDYGHAYSEEELDQLVNELVKTRAIDEKVAETLSLYKIQAFLQSNFGHFLHQHASLLKKEQPFSTVLSAQDLFQGIQDDSPVLIHGIIDGFVELEDHIILFDYKTDYYQEVQEMVDKYKIQLSLYAQALELSYRKPVKQQLLILLHKNQVVDCLSGQVLDK